MRLRYLILMLLVAAARAQTTTVAAQILDPSGAPYRNGSVTANFINNDTKIANWNGSPLTVTTWSTNADSNANFTLQLPDSAFIGPATNVLYTFRICANSTPPPPLPSPSGQPANPCFTYTSPVCPTVGCITGSTINITAAIKAVAVLLPTTGGTITGISTPPGSGLQGGGTSGTLTLGLITTCAPTQVLSWNGTAWVCAAGGDGGGGGSPGAPFNSVQYNAAGTLGGASNFTYNSILTPGEADFASLNNIRGVTACSATATPQPPCYNWQRTLGVSLTGGVPSSVTLTPCPVGISGADTIGRIVLDLGLSSQEVVVLSGGASCTSGGSSGTVQFTPVQSHSPSGTIGSASDGIYEAMVAGNNNMRLVLNPAGAATNISQIYNVQGSISVPHGMTIDGAGSLLNCSTRDYCMQATAATVILDRVRFASSLDVDGWPIASTQCATGTTTITTTVPHGIIVGDVVDVQWTDNHHYWGGSVSTNTRVSAVTSTTVSYPDSCASPISLTATPGFINIVNASFLASTTGNVIERMVHGNPSSIIGHFNNGIVVLNDQANVIDKFFCCQMQGDSPDVNQCNATNGYCGWAIYAPGPFSPNASLISVSDSNLSVNCGGNGIGYFAGNTLSVHNTIIQGYSQIGIWTGTPRGGFERTDTGDVYEEVGACNNPIYPIGQGGFAGVINMGTPMTWSAGAGPAGPAPTVATGGPTIYYWYTVIRDSVDGPSAPFYVGGGSPTSTVTITWPRTPTPNTTTYDLIRTTDASNIPTTAACVGGSTSACGSVTVNMAQCSTGLSCSFTDNVTVATTAYTVTDPPTFIPYWWFWPGAFVAQAGTDGLASATPDCGGFFSVHAQAISTSVTANVGTLFPCLFTDAQASSGQGTANGWISSLENLGPNQAATLINEQDRVTGGPFKGRLNFHRTVGSTVQQMDYATFVDSNPTKTGASSLKWPTADPSDTAISNDVAGAALNATGMGIRAPGGVRMYSNTLADGVSWMAGFTPSLGEFRVPTQFDQPMKALIGCSGCGPFNLTGTQVSDTFNRGSLGANYTTLLGGFGITTNSAGTSVVYVSAVASESGMSRAYAYYSGLSFSNDQYIQMQFGVTGNIAGECVRMAASSPLTAYCVVAGDGGLTAIEKFVAGAETTLYTTASSPALGTYVTLQVVGSTISLTENGTFVTSVTDTAISSGSPGLYGQNSAGAGLSQIWNLNAGNVSWTANVNIAIGGKLNQVNAGTWAGTCTMTAGACSSIPLSYTSAPACQVTWTGTGTLTGALSSNRTSSAIQPKSSIGTDTAVVDWMCVGNPN